MWLAGITDEDRARAPAHDRREINLFRVAKEMLHMCTACVFAIRPSLPNK